MSSIEDPWSPLVLNFKRQCIEEIETNFHTDAHRLLGLFFDKFLEAGTPHPFRLWNAVTWMMLEMRVGETVGSHGGQDTLWLRHARTLPDVGVFSLGEGVMSADCCGMLLGLQRKRNYTAVPQEGWDKYWTIHEEMVQAGMLRYPAWRAVVPVGMMAAAQDIARLSKALDAVCNDCADVVVGHPRYSYHLQALEGRD